MIVSFILNATLSSHPPPDEPGEETLVAVTPAAPEVEPAPPDETVPATPSRGRRVPPWVWILLVVGLVLLCTCCLCAVLGAGAWAVSGSVPTSAGPFRTSNPGIDTPITVEGVQVQVTSAKRQASYTSVGRTHRPTRASDELLVIEATLSGGTDSQPILKWQVFTIDETGRKDVPGVSSVTSDKDERPTKATWVIAVAKTSRSFILHLPGDKTIDLAPLLSSAP